MIKGFTQEFKRFAAERCSKALVEFPGYLEREQAEEVDQDEIHADSQLICYLQGYRDGNNMRNGQL